MNRVLITITVRESGSVEGMLGGPLGVSVAVSKGIMRLMFPGASELTWTRKEEGCFFVGRMPVMGSREERTLFDAIKADVKSKGPKKRGKKKK